MRVATALFVALAVVPAHTEAATNRARYLMGTVCEVAVAGNAESAAASIERAFAEAERIERFLSTWKPESELSRVNAGAQPSAELAELLATALAWSKKTGGAFDPRVRALIEVWKTREDGALPAPEQIAQALANKQQFEEGAFGKGYALDRMLATIDGDALIDFGGQLLVRGSRRVAIADPADREKPVVELTLADASLSTSSGSEKTFEVDGRRFSHIVDPRTGQALPPRGSVSVIADDALTADILSTALYVMGEDDGLRWANAHGVAALYLTNRNVRLSDAARERARGLTLLDRNYSMKD